MNREDADQTERPDSEVKTPYGRFSAKEKLRILEEAEACTEPRTETIPMSGGRWDVNLCVHLGLGGSVP